MKSATDRNLRYHKPNGIVVYMGNGVKKSEQRSVGKSRARVWKAAQRSKRNVSTSTRRWHVLKTNNECTSRYRREMSAVTCERERETNGGNTEHKTRESERTTTRPRRRNGDKTHTPTWTRRPLNRLLVRDRTVSVERFRFWNDNYYVVRRRGTEYRIVVTFQRRIKISTRISTISIDLHVRDRTHPMDDKQSVFIFFFLNIFTAAMTYDNSSWNGYCFMTFLARRSINKSLSLLKYYEWVRRACL